MVEPAVPAAGSGADADDPLNVLRRELGALHLHAGNPSLRRIANKIGAGVISHTTIGAVLRCSKVPGWGQLELVVECLGGDVEMFRGWWKAAVVVGRTGAPATGTGTDGISAGGLVDDLPVEGRAFPTTAFPTSVDGTGWIPAVASPVDEQALADADRLDLISAQETRTHPRRDGTQQEADQLRASVMELRLQNSALRAEVENRERRIGQLLEVVHEHWPVDGICLTGHGGAVWSVAFSPDGQLLASGSDDGTVRLWDPATGAPTGRPLIGHDDEVGSVVFSRDGRLLASAGFDGSMRLWNPTTGAPVGRPLVGHDGAVWSVVFSPDGQQLASAGYDGSVRLWDPATGAQVGQPLIGHHGAVGSVGFSPDGRLLASGGFDGKVRLWDPVTGSPAGRPLIGHDGAVRSVVFSPNGRLLASGGFDGKVRLWMPDTSTAITRPLIGHHYTVMSVVFSPNGRLLASGGLDSRVRFWDSGSGAQLAQPVSGHSGPVRSVVFSPDGRLLASGSDDQSVRLRSARHLGVEPRFIG
ncbi:hypothetical protein AB0J72_54750 [Dactylosporangium sp. NPDC049742]|uniref:hypothetical protein n=1 Tax=Dactylosporangium sp. NPDC049742 TaxID=3154737 RepID=UPI00344A1E92